jgi:hypothetical protein
VTLPWLHQSCKRRQKNEKKKTKGEEKVVPMSVIDEEAPSYNITAAEPSKSGIAMDAKIQTEKDDEEGENKLL